MALEQFSRGEKLALGGSAVAAVGSFMPWIDATVLGISRTVTGTEGGDGWIVLIAVGIAAAAVYLGDESWYRRYGVGALGLIAAGIGAMYISDPTAGIEFDSATQAQIAQGAFNPAMGLYVVLVGGVLVIAGAVDGFDSPRTARGPAATPRRGEPAPGGQARQRGSPQQSGPERAQDQPRNANAQPQNRPQGQQPSRQRSREGGSRQDAGRDGQNAGHDRQDAGRDRQNAGRDGQSSGGGAGTREQ